MGGLFEVLGWRKWFGEVWLSVVGFMCCSLYLQVCSYTIRKDKSIDEETGNQAKQMTVLVSC